MQHNIRDLWPKDLSMISKSNSPSSILMEQAEILAQKTGDLVRAEVITPEIPIHSGFLDYNFFIVAPRLNHYRYRLFSIWYDLNLYPVFFELDSDIDAEVRGKKRGELRAKSEQEYIDLLGKILNAEKTRRIIRTLVSLVEEMKATSNGG